MKTCMLCRTAEWNTENDFLCGKCTQIFINSTPEHLKKAYEAAVKQKRHDLSNFLSKYVEEENEINGSNLDGKRVGRKTRTTHNKIRPKRSIRQLDKGRS